MAEALPRTGSDFDFDLLAAIERHAAQRLGEPAFESIGPEERDSISWGQLLQEARALSCFLLDCGIQPGDRVAILMENQPRWPVAFFAAYCAGATAVPLDTVAPVTSLVDVLRHSDAGLLLASAKFAEHVGRIREALPALPILSTGPEWDRAVSQPGSMFPARPRSMDDDLALLYTGGTTGRPKGVLLSGRNLGRSITDMLQVFPLTVRDRVLSVLPLFHIMPLLANLMAPAYTGCSVVFLNQLDPEALRCAFEREKITAFLCVPQFYYQIQRRIQEEVARQSRAKQRQFGALMRISRTLRTRFGIFAGRLFFRPVHARFGQHLRAFGVGGAYFNPSCGQFFADLGFQMFQAYGLTECAGLATATRLDKHGALSCGQAVSHCELRIGQPDAAGAGEILIRGENIMRGYWREAAATADVIQDGWLHTGDLGTIRADGSLQITGRAKDVIVLSSGKNVFPEELEDWFLRRCPAIAEICLVGIESEQGAILHCAVYPKAVPEGCQAMAELREAAKLLPTYKRPGSAQIVNEPLPRTTTRKLQRYKVREMVVAGPKVSEGAEAPDSGDPVERQVSSLIRRIRPGSAIQPHMHLEFDLRLDSLERIELISNMERAFSVAIPAEDGARLFTVEDLVREARRGSFDGASNETWSDWMKIIRAPLTAEESAFAARYLRRRALLEPAWFLMARVIQVAARASMQLRIAQEGSFPDGPFMLCPNHASYLDTPVACCMLPYSVFSRVFLLGLSRYFRAPLWQWTASLLRIVSVDTDRHLMSGMRIGKAGLEKGLVLWVYPEGTRSVDGRIQQLRKGPALLARALNVPVVPMGIAGTHEVWPRGSSFQRLAKVAVATGAPMIPAEEETPEAFNTRLHAAIARQLEIAENLRA